MIDPGLLPKDGKKLSLNDAEIHYYESFFSTIEAETLFKQLLNETSWQQDPITVFGKTYPQPRLTALYANNSKALFLLRNYNATQDDDPAAQGDSDQDR
jgi:hypothetical protein